MTPETNVVSLHSDLAECEAVIERYRTSYHEASQALLDIFEAQLWAESGYSSFEEYVVRRWEFQKTHAYRLVETGRFLRTLSLSPAGESPPASERHVRALMQIRGRRDEDPELVMQKRVNAWQVVQDQARNDKAEITERYVTGVVNRFFRGGDKVKPKDKPRNWEPKDLEAALMTLYAIFEAHDDGEAMMDKFGHPETWPRFRDVLVWMQFYAK